MYSITKNGVCAKHLCVIDEVNKIVATSEDGLVFDFSGLSGWSFKTGSDCIFKTGYGCAFDTGSHCSFKTGYGCAFDTGSHCSFKTGSHCSFNAGDYCSFNAGSHCTFNASYNCTFKTGFGCTFKTGSDCIFNTSYDCTFKVGEGCVVIRRDIYEVIELMSGVTIKLNNTGLSGYVFNRDEYIEKIGVNEEKLVFKLANEEWVSCIQ